MLYSALALDIMVIFSTKEQLSYFILDFSLWLPCHQNKKAKVGIRKEYILNFL